MTNEEAIGILNTKRREDFYTEKTVNEACKIGIKAIKQAMIPQKVDLTETYTVKALDVELNKVLTYPSAPCPNCKQWIIVNKSINFCQRCGQKLDWGEKNA